MSPKTICLIDTETTGLAPATDKCIEVACILYSIEHAAPIASYASLIRSDSNAAEAINRIPAALLQSAPEADRVWAYVKALVSRSDAVVAHRAEFDRGFVPAHIGDTIPWICSKFHIEWPHGAPGDGLVSLALAHDLGVVQAHRALTDCDTLARLFQRVHSLGRDVAAMLERAMRPRVKLIADVSFDEKDKAKSAGFAWNPDTQQWWRDVPKEDAVNFPFPTREATAA